MADEMDFAQRYEQEERERNIVRACRRPTLPSRLTCEECEAPIPEARRAILPGVTLCIACQGIAELKSKHYRGNV